MNVNILLETKVVEGTTNYRAKVIAADDLSVRLTLSVPESLVNFGWSENEDIARHSAHEWAKRNNHTVVCRPE